MAQKTLRDYSAPSANQVPTGPEVNTGGENFEIKMGLITMVQASPFCGRANEDTSAHLQQFLELCSTFVIKGVSQDAIRLRLFPFSLLGRAKQWFYANKAAVDTWDKCAKAFLAKFFPTGKTNALREQNQMSQFLKLGRDFRSASLRVCTMGWTIGLFFRTSTTG